jgi:fructose-bisphosphate aldolase class II
VPTAVHLDHATSADLIEDAVALGFGSVMYDGSALSYSDNVRETARIAAWCHDRGIFVEAELGEVGGKDGVHAPGVRTDPREATEFVCGTGVDALAVAVGSSHAMATRDAVLDLELVRRIRATVPVPLVLHGSSGVPDETLDAAIRAGLTKINIATQLNKMFTRAVRDYLAGDGAATDPRGYLTAGRDAVATEVARLLGVLRADAGSRV